MVIAIMCHVTCLLGLHIRQMDLQNDCDYHKCRQVVTPVAADIPDALFLLEQINTTP